MADDPRSGAELTAGHDDHAHSRVTAGADTRRLAAALALIVAFMAAEVAAGIVAHSLALISDAAHMLTDAGAIGLSLVAARLARRPAEGAMTFGLKRAEILSAQANGVTLLVLAGLIVVEAVRRLISPPDVEGALVLVVSLVGIVVNLLAIWQLAKASRWSLNVEGSYRHIVTDLYAFAGTALAGVVILTTGFVRIDPIASLVVAASMLWAALGLLRDSGRILLEGAPKGVDVEDVGQALASYSGVVDVHDLHVWEITSGFPSLSAHVLVRPGADCHALRRELERMLAERFELTHTTLQVDHAARGGLVHLRRSGRPHH